MDKSQPIKDPQTFRNPHQQNLDPKDLSKDHNQTALNSLHYSSLDDHSKQAFHCLCGQTNSQTYKCEICNRLRLVCPYGQNRKNTAYRSVSNTHKTNHHSTNINRSGINKKIAGCRICERNGVNLSQISQTNHLKPPPRIIGTPQAIKQQNKPIIIEEIIYYPVFHNIYKETRSQSRVKNPESADQFSKMDETFASPQYKYRHRVSTNQPQSSPIKVEEYDANTILTPEKIKQLTQSMIQ